MINPEDETRFERVLTGALRSAIHDHGPITPEHIGSAVKRIRGALKVDNPMTEPQRLLTDAEVEEIRWGVREGIRGPVMLKWVEQLLRDRDERVMLDIQKEGRWRRHP